jgi:hypothetical protein
MKDDSNTAQRKLDADILVDARRTYEGVSHLYAAQSLEGARELVRALRAAGWEARIRMWAHDAVRVTSDLRIGGYREVA